MKYYVDILKHLRKSEWYYSLGLINHLSNVKNAQLWEIYCTWLL